MQLQFDSPTSGWMVIQQMTSQALSSATLMKTTDGGLTWTPYVLPSVGEVSFPSQSEGWLINRANDQLFHSTDAGLTWTPAQLSEYPQSQSNYPAGTARSGWQSGSIGWAATSQGGCSGEKSSPGFTCLVDRALWQTLDGGQHWDKIPLPADHQGINSTMP
jgi:photosystem II stability/assembly factor-like uncharacterized protein